MEKVPLTRRGFLRLCVVTAGGVVVSACQQMLKDITAVTQVVPSATPGQTTKINLTGTDQDVWTWMKPVKVEVAGECEKVIVHVNGNEFEARPEGKHFT